MVHKLVAKAFCENVENKPFVDHIDGNKINNNAENLRWVTHKENCDNANTKRYKPVVQKSNGETVATYKSVTEASILTGISTPAISNCAQGKSKTAGGFLWEFKKI